MAQFYFVFFLVLLSQSGHCNEYIYPIRDNRVVEYSFVLTEGPVQPDNFVQSGYLINGLFPGPPIFCNQYDLLRVTVENRMSIPTSIHFHGILQSVTVASDGVPYVTQLPIAPNTTFIYEIQVGFQTGTYLYHGHHDLDFVFLHGALIVRDHPKFWHRLGYQFKYDEGHEHSFLLEAIYHYSLQQFFKDITGLWVGPPDFMGIAINGQSFGKWGSQNGNAPGYEVVKVTPKKTYRFRVISIPTDAFFLFKIEGHRFKVIEMDGILTDPVWTDRLEIASGQRYSVLVTMDQPVANYWITCEFLDAGGSPQGGRAILSYSGAPSPNSNRTRLFPDSTSGSDPTPWILSQLNPTRYVRQPGVYPLPRKSHRKILIDWHMRTTEDGRRQVLLNGNHFEAPKVPYLTQVREGIDIAKGSTQVIPIYEGEVIDLVFQNRPIADVNDEVACDTHPIHIHGHSFWVILEGSDTVDISKLDKLMTDKLYDRRYGERFQFRDVFTMYPSQTVGNSSFDAGCGWAVIRFIANNPGIWLGHCHITTHMIMGKQFVLYEYNRDNPELINE